MSAREDIINRNALFNTIPETLIKSFLWFHYLAKAMILKCINPQRYATYLFNIMLPKSIKEAKHTMSDHWHLYKQRISLHLPSVFLYNVFYIGIADSISEGFVPCEGEIDRDIVKERFSIPLSVIRVSLGRSLSHSHLCLLTCGRQTRGRNTERERQNVPLII